MAEGSVEAESRIDALETLVSRTRHDLNGALTPALMVADRLRGSDDQAMKIAGEKIAASILRATDILKATRDLVPPRGQ